MLKLIFHLSYMNQWCISYGMQSLLELVPRLLLLKNEHFNLNSYENGCDENMHNYFSYAILLSSAVNKL